MKKIIILLVIMFAAIGTVVAQQQRKQTVKNTTVSAEEHLCFEGVPIDGDVNSFVKKLAAKGIKVSTVKGKNDSKRLHDDVLRCPN